MTIFNKTIKQKKKKIRKPIDPIRIFSLFMNQSVPQCYSRTKTVTKRRCEIEVVNLTVALIRGLRSAFTLRTWYLIFLEKSRVLLFSLYLCTLVPRCPASLSRIRSTSDSLACRKNFTLSTPVHSATKIEYKTQIQLAPTGLESNS